MNQDRRTFIELMALTSSYGVAPQLFAQSNLADVYPKKPIRILCPFAPSGGVDITARSVAQQLTQAWGQSVIVDNKPVKCHCGKAPVEINVLNGIVHANCEDHRVPLSGVSK